MGARENYSRTMGILPMLHGRDARGTKRLSPSLGLVLKDSDDRAVVVLRASHRAAKPEDGAGVVPRADDGAEIIDG